MMKRLIDLERKDLLFNGIYRITNVRNGKIYVGSCSSKSFLYERLIHHRFDLMSNRHHNKYLQRSFNKYGPNSFYYDILEATIPNLCVEREQYWIDLLKPHYNSCKTAGSSFGRVCDVSTKEKISLSNKSWWSNKENKLRMKASFAKRVKRVKKAKIKKDYHGGCKKVLNLDTLEVYNSVIEASKSLNISYNFTISILNDKKKSNKNIKYV